MILGQLLFDLRAHAGAYTLRGDPAFARQNKDFEQVGTKTGVAFTVAPSTFPSFTITATETLLYGAAGSVRNLHLFETSLTLNLDPKSYFGLTFGYTNGFNEDTAVRQQSWTAGLSARY